MKINSIQNYNLQKNPFSEKRNNNKPSFQATVNILTKNCDVICNRYIDLSKEPLKELVAKIKPHLEKIMDKNLVIDVSGAGNPLTLSTFFKDSVGLKFDIGFHDIKRYYYEVLMKDSELSKILEKPQYEKLIKKDTYSMYCLGSKVGVARLYEPSKGDTPETFIKEVIPRIKEQARLLPRFLIKPKDPMESIQRQKYRGIDFDYPRIMQEYYD